MKFQKIETGPHQIKQYTFRINEKEIESLLTVLEISKNMVPRSQYSPLVKELRRHVDIATKELRRASKIKEE